MANPDFTRQELQIIRERAEGKANIPNLNSGWKRMYLALADAANHLDAAIARTTITVGETIEIPAKEAKKDG